MSNDNLTDATRIIIKQIASWAQPEPDNRTAIAVMRDKTTKTSTIHYAGRAAEIGKCVNDLMHSDSEIARAIYCAATVFAHRQYEPEYINKINDNAALIANLRRMGASDETVNAIMTNII